MFLLLVLQPMFAYAFRSTMPALSAVHAVSGVFAFGVALRLERMARQRERRGSVAAEV